tara:strand:+ start:114 stop:1091 length:978 start_codon:yes stop_codon:yes gene_type:complete
MTELKVGVIGCGGHAQTHFQEIKEEKRLHLAAIAEINPERREKTAQMHKPDVSFSDYQDMLQKIDLDIVYVETMPGHLLPIVTACLEEGINTSVEKPPGMNSKETQILADTAKKGKAKTIVSFNRRYFPEVLAVRQEIQKSGGAVHVGATYNKPISTLVHPSLKNMVPDPVICDAIHHVDLLRWMAGSSTTTASEAIEVYSIVHDGPREGSHRHNASIKFASGTIGSMMSHYGVGYRVQRAEVHSEDLSFYLDLTTNNRLVEHYNKGKATSRKLNLESIGGPEYNETRHFVDCILENKTPWSNLDDAVHTMKLCEAIRRGHKGPL